MKRRITVLLGTMLLLGTFFVATAPVSATPLVAVTLCENSAPGVGDCTTHTFFGTWHLPGYSANLVNGCNGQLGTYHGDWNDCASYTGTGNIPSGYRVEWWSNDPPGGIRYYCAAGPGYVPGFNLGFSANDNISSVRLTAGGC